MGPQQPTSPLPVLDQSTSLPPFHKRSKIILFILLPLLLFAGLVFGYNYYQSTKSPWPDEIRYQSPSPTPITTTKNPGENYLLVPVEVPENWSIWRGMNQWNNTCSATIYLPPGQEIKMPSLLSDYNFVSSMSNSAYTPADGNTYEYCRFSMTLYSKIEPFENDQFIGNYYNDNQGGVWLKANSREFTDSSGNFMSIVAHSRSISTIEKILDELGSFNKVSLDEMPSQRMYINPQPVHMPVNYTFTNEQGDTYLLYVPPGYAESDSDFDYPTIGPFTNNKGVTICTDLAAGWGCRSNPGGPCTNSWGALADYMIHPSSDDYPYDISAINICGDREAEFVVHNETTRLGGTFRSAAKDYPEVLNLYYMLDSIQK